MYEFEILYDTHAIKQFSENLISTYNCILA
jgi:hypothetical protein